MKRPQWEYMVLSFQGGNNADTEKRLSNLGSEGWELVAVAVQFTSHTCYLRRVA